MNDVIQRLVNAIIRQEGMPTTYANPGNLRGAPWLKIVPMENGFWLPTSREQGVAGLAHLVALHLAQGNSLHDFIAGHPGVYAGFAPGADHNDPVKYIADVKLWAAIADETLPLWNFLAATPVVS